jgi:hypothetical protein
MNTIYFDKTAFTDLKLTLTPNQSDAAATEFAGKGLGRLHYLLAAKVVYERTGHVFHSDQRDNMTREAQKLWVRLVKDGFAEFVSLRDSSYAIQPLVLKQSRELREIYEIFRDRIEDCKAP